MKNRIKNIIEDSLIEMSQIVDDGLNRSPVGLNGLELDELKEELELCLELIKKQETDKKM